MATSIKVWIIVCRKPKIRYLVGPFSIDVSKMPALPISSPTKKLIKRNGDLALSSQSLRMPTVKNANDDP